ncbi:MAG: carboxypeptidase-like regulatory domain-containing protein [Bacteroidales bacterium]|nr:carboxypeptidase-like regulatory domain-containing protein [Bacteroidales bacterium]
MRYFNLVVVLFFLSINTYCQTMVSAIVKDKQTNEILPYCNVSVVGTNRGTITNSDGLFGINVKSANDVLEFSYLGYQNKSITAASLRDDKIVFLDKNTYELQEVEIHAKSDYLYDILTKSRKNLQQNKASHISKAYYALESKATPLEMFSHKTSKDSLKTVVTELKIFSPEKQEEKTVELLECFYNARVTGAKITDLKFRNGKVFSQPAENYFFSLHSSKAMGQFCFFEKNEIFPSCPFQYSKIMMKRLFKLELLSFDGLIYHIKFEPYDNFDKYFYGDVWIDKETMQVLKINLVTENTKIYPLAPEAVVDTINNFSLNISNSFNPNNKYLPDYTVFDYDFIYDSRGSVLISKSDFKIVKSKISSKGLIYYYDYGNPFLLPFFDYDFDYNDYALMSLFPYNYDFWKTNNIVQLTKDQKSKFEIGQSLNIESKYLGYDENNEHVKGYWTNEGINMSSQIFMFWFSDKRLVFAKAAKYKDFFESAQSAFPGDLCRLEVQILLDVSVTEDSAICKSWTVFNTMRSVYKYPATPETGAFINIYFDLCEMERQKMQKQLDSNRYTLSEIEIIYNSTTSKMEGITKQLINETDRGRDYDALEKWNEYVLENLGIDNLKIIKNM